MAPIPPPGDLKFATLFSWIFTNCLFVPSGTYHSSAMSGGSDGRTVVFQSLVGCRYALKLDAIPDIFKTSVKFSSK